jgi:hypothetical protein
MKKNKNLPHSIWVSGQDLNPVPSEYAVGELIIQRRITALSIFEK